MNHLQQRLAERHIVIDTSKLYSIANGCNEDTAVIIQRLDCHAGIMSMVIMIGKNLMVIWSFSLYEIESLIQLCTGGVIRKIHPMQ